MVWPYQGMLREKCDLGLFDSVTRPSRVETPVHPRQQPSGRQPDQHTGGQPGEPVDATEPGGSGGDPTDASDAEAQHHPVVLLTNRRSARTSAGDGSALPLRDGIHVYTEGFDAAVTTRYATVADRIGQADIALLRVPAGTPAGGVRAAGRPSLGPGGADSTELEPDELDRLLDIAASIPTVVVLGLRRPVVVPDLADHCAALVAEFGADDAAVLDVLFGYHAPTGRLPFDLPSSTEAVPVSHPNAPIDTPDPVFRFGHGLTY